MTQTPTRTAIGQETLREASLRLAHIFGHEGAAAEVALSSIETYGADLLRRHPTLSESDHEAIVAVFKATVSENLGSLWTTLAEAWEARFTADEIRTLADFFGSATGGKYLASIDAMERADKQALHAWLSETFTMALDRSVAAGLFPDDPSEPDGDGPET